MIANNAAPLIPHALAKQILQIIDHTVSISMECMPDTLETRLGFCPQGSPGPRSPMCQLSTQSLRIAEIYGGLIHRGSRTVQLVYSLPHSQHQFAVAAPFAWSDSIEVSDLSNILIK